MHGTVVVAAGGMVGAGKVFYAIGKVGVGIAQAFGIAGVAQGFRGRELDLHQPDGAAMADQIRTVFAFAHDYAVHQRSRHLIGARVPRNHRIIVALASFRVARERDCPKRSGETERDPAKLQETSPREFSNAAH
jgi:hypothetical protein